MLDRARDPIIKLEQPSHALLTEAAPTISDGDMRATRLSAGSVLATLVWAASTVTPVSAQSAAVTAAQTTPPAPNAKAAKSGHGDRNTGWRVSPALGLDAQYDDNVFYLSPTRKSDVAAPSSAQQISGRYNDMTSASDVLTTMSASLTVKGPGLMGKSSILVPEVSYDLYAQNTARSNVNLGLSLQQELWADGRLRLQGRLTPSYFARNYMADAVDQDSNGSISESERIYAAGDYREGELGADYRLPLAKATRNHSFGAALQFGGGYYSRSYDAPLTGRDLNGPTASAKMLLDLGRRVDLDLGYDYASVGAPPSNQVLLLDEPVYGQDLNGNGTVTDQNARVLTVVDRSRKEQNLGAFLRFGPSQAMDVKLGYEYRWRRYTSTEPLDGVDRGRTDKRRQISADLRLRLMKDLRLRLGGIHATQKLNRAGDPAGEIDDYTRSLARLGLSYQM